MDTMNIGIRKEVQTDSVCTYMFICTVYRRRTDGKRLEEAGDVTGRFCIDRESGAATLIEPMPGDEAKRAYLRASYKIFKYWKAGELPDFARYCAG
ncbi:hypothetical protein [Stenotrophomonas sp.]|uniref:hypothetical protein n=1 Tax=Stenotrophomonas sp. TaxID=69392 RepID=UPI0028990698|nr:hypothetical protein [Stenotrophomonas sp.]